jgi:VWFA-related protein
MGERCLSAQRRPPARDLIYIYFARFFLTLLLITLASPAGAQESSASPAYPNDYTISVNVNVVVLRATVQTRENVLVSGLSQDAFQIYEGGVLQQIKYFSHDDVPVTAGLVVDNSASMRPKRAEVIAAALAFVRSSNPQDQMFVVNFNENVSFGLPDRMPFTDSIDRLEVALSRVAADGQTALYDAIAAGLDRLKQGSNDKKVLIVISDGGDNASKHTLAQIMSMAGQSNAIIYTIGIFDAQDEDRNPRVLKQLASKTGGEPFLPDSLKEVTPICEQIAHDIRNQYTLAYAPSDKSRDGAYRTISVKASGPGRGHLLVRTRTGYFAPTTAPSSPETKAVQP